MHEQHTEQGDSTINACVRVLRSVPHVVNIRVRKAHTGSIGTYRQRTIARMITTPFIRLGIRL